MHTRATPTSRRPRRVRAVTAARRTRLLSAASRRHSTDRWAGRGGAGRGRAAALHTRLVQVVPSMMSDLEDVYLSVVAAVRDMVRVATGDIAHKVGVALVILDSR